MRETELPLTARQREICRMIADLKSVKRIAYELGISTNTVQNHIQIAARHIPGRGQPIVKIVRYFSTMS